MGLFAINQIIILLLQCLLVAALLLFLFRIRTIFGLGLLFTALGVFQYMQVFLATSLYIEVYPGIMVTPGSMVMYTGSLFAILLIYIREDALEARKVIYALLAANLVLAFLQVVFSWAIDGESVNNIYNLPKEFFQINSRVLFVGTIVLFIDAFVIIFIYETISKFVKHLFMRIFISMTIVITLDSLLFSIGAFLGTEQFTDILVSGLISKLSSSMVYAAIFSIYLAYLDKGFVMKDTATKDFEDIFYTLTYRQKFEKVYEEKESQKIELQKSEDYNRLLYNSSPIGLVLSRIDNTIVDINPAFANILGRSVEETLKLNKWEIIPEKYIQKENQIIEVLEKDDKISIYETEFIHNDGHLVPVIIRVQLFERDNENFIMSSVEDITKRKLAEDELKKHRENLEDLVRERTKNLEDKNTELEKFNNLFVDREFRMKELRDELDSLKSGKEN